MFNRQKNVSLRRLFIGKCKLVLIIHKPMKKTNLQQSFLLSLLVVLAFISCRINHEQEVIAVIDASFSQAFSADGPGGAVLIVKGGKVLLDKGYGLADMETKVPITGDTFFNIGSMSKQFTAVAILQLAGEGKLSLDDNIHTFFPEFRADFWDRITIHHLLCHTSGVPDARDAIPVDVKLLATDSISMAYMYDLDYLNFEPGEKYEYINPTFVLLGRIVEKVSGQEFETYMREHVFTPAGMKNTIYYAPGRDALIPAFAHGYAFNAKDYKWHEKDFGETTFFATRPDGGLCTSTHEFLAWERALRSGSVLDKETLALAQSPKVVTSEDSLSFYGYGWNVIHRKDASEYIYHGGSNGGFRSLGVYYPASDTELIIFLNRSGFDVGKYKAMIEEKLGI